MTTATPRPRADLRAWPLFQRGDETQYLVGSRTVDRYIVVDAERYPVVMHIIRGLQQGLSPDEVQAQLAREGIAVDVAAFVQLLARAGLTDQAEADASPRAGRSLRALSWKLVSLPLKTHWPHTPQLWKALTGVLAAWLGLSILLVGWTVTRQGWLPLLPTLRALQWARHHHPWLWLGLYLGLWFVALPLHEAGHAILASAGGVYPRSLFVRLYVGVWPLVSIQLPGLYTLPLRWRVAAMAAGPLMNLALANTAWLLGAWVAATSTVRTFWFALAVFNYLIFALNGLPFAPLDGYYVLSQGLFRELDIRSRAWKAWRAWRQGAGSRPRLAYWLFLGLDVGLLALVVAFLGVQVHRLLARWLLHPNTWCIQHLPLPLVWLLLGLGDFLFVFIITQRLMGLLGIRRSLG